MHILTDDKSATSGGIEKINPYRMSRKKPIATAYFRFSHRDKSNTALTNNEQKIVVENII
jgi:hypothetical protein